MHKLHRIHRDVKCANVLINEQGEIKLGDFGASSLTEPAREFVGSPCYLAPEIISALETTNGSYNSKVDIWSLGITCIELAEKNPPLHDMDAMTLMVEIPQNDPPKLKDPSSWSEQFSDFIEKCLRKNPDERFSAEQLLQV